MMRYQIQSDEVYQNYNGDSITVKWFRDIPSYSVLKRESVVKGVLFDALYSRSDYYGDGSENDSYKIPEANVPALVDYKFDVDKLKEVIIPA